MSEENNENQNNDDDKPSIEDRLAALEADNKEKQEEIERLRNKSDTLLDEKKQQQQKAREAEEEARKERMAKAEKENDFEQLLADNKQMLADSEKKRQELEEQLQSQAKKTESNNHMTEALKIAASMASDTTRAEDLAEKIVKRSKYVDGKLKVLDEDGELTVDPVEKLQEQLTAKYPYLVDGSKANGGNASGNADTNTRKAPNQKAEDAKKKGDVHGYIRASLEAAKDKGNK